MGNLPRSRPGRRSDKRASGSPGGARQDGGSGSAKRAKPARAPSNAARGTAPGSRSGRAGSSRPAGGGPSGPPPSGGPDPIGDAFRVAGKLAGAGLGIAAGVLRRLPKP